MKRFLLLVGLLIIFAACAKEEKPAIEVSGAIVTPSPMMQNAYSVFMIIENKGNVGDSLIGFDVEGINARNELHDVVGGKMVKIDKIDVPAKSKVELKRGSLHLMIINPDKKITSDINIILKFEKSGEVKVKAKYVEQTGEMHMQMGETQQEEEIQFGCG